MGVGLDGLPGIVRKDFLFTIVGRDGHVGTDGPGPFFGGHSRRSLIPRPRCYIAQEQRPAISRTIFSGKNLEMGPYVLVAGVGGVESVRLPTYSNRRRPMAHPRFHRGVRDDPPRLCCARFQRVSSASHQLDIGMDSALLDEVM
jgi:hypothetical protein